MHSLPSCRLCHSANRKGDFLRKQLSKKAAAQVLLLLLSAAFLVYGASRGEAGVVLNKVDEASRLFVESDPAVGYQQEDRFSGKNFFVEPAFGIKFGLCRHVALNVSVAYEWDAVKQKHQSRNSDFKVDWSGYRAQAGLIFYLNLKK